MPDDTRAAPRPTLKTIAAETGLAITTVSRALKDAPDIGAATKRRVRGVADRLGYRPNRAGVRLRTGRSNVVSILMAQETDMVGHTARLIHSFASALRGTGYHLIVTPTFDAEDPLDQLRYLRDTGSADAVVINKVRPQDARIAFLHEHAIPFVTHGRSDMGIAHGWYDYDNERFAALAAGALAARGRRDLLVVAPPLDQTYAGHIMAGAEAAARAAGMRCTRLEEVTSDSASPLIEAALARRLEAASHDAILCSSAASAVAAVAAIEGTGRAVGDQVDVAGKESFPFLNRFREPILALREDMDAAGTFLAQAALTAIERPGEPMTRLQVPSLGEG